MRDQFAMAAMAALIQSTWELTTTEGYSASECAQDAYLYADMMLRERKVKRDRRVTIDRIERRAVKNEKHQNWKATQRKTA
jgi:hypothetical protein